MQQVFTQEEMDDRLRFSMFFGRNFVYKQRHTTYLNQPMPVRWIHQLYQSIYPDTKLSAADLEAMFTQAGALRPSGDVVLDLNVTDIRNIPQMIQAAVLPFLQPKQLMRLSIQPVGASRLSSNSQINHLRSFIFLFIKRTNQDVRVLIKDITQLYVQYCSLHRQQPVSPRMLGIELRQFIGPVVKGYVRGQAGVNFVRCMIPPEELWSPSLRLGLGIFPYLGGLYDNEGKAMQLTDDLQPANERTVAHIGARIQRGAKHEQGPEEASSAESKEERETLIDGRAEESYVKDDSSSEETDDAKAFDDTDEIGDVAREESEDPEDAEDEITGSIDESSENGPGQPAADLRKSRPKRNAEQSPGHHRKEQAKLRALFMTLEISYRIHTGAYTLQDMQDDLELAGSDLAAADIWDDFMNFIGGNDDKTTNMSDMQ